MIGIYKITNILNNKVYIGQSASIKSRWCNHKCGLRTNTHSSRHLQSSWNKYGEENFNFEVVEECSIEELNDKESYYIDFHNSLNPEFGYNRVQDGVNKRRLTETILVFVNKYNFSKRREHSIKEFIEITGKHPYKAIERNRHKDWFVFYKDTFTEDILLNYKQQKPPKHLSKPRSTFKQEGNFLVKITRQPMIKRERF